MSPFRPSIPVAVRLRSRAEVASAEVSALERLAIDARLRPILVAANAEVRRVRERIAANVDVVDEESLDRSLMAIETRLRLVRGAVNPLSAPASQVRFGRH